MPEGKNPLLRGKISEIFKSVQGEGIYQGTTQIFVRFYGCGIKCAFCDTNITSYKEKTVEETVSEINALGEHTSISLTGGEPLEQADFLEILASNLKKNGKIIYLETAGILSDNLKKVIEHIDIIAMDFKLPSSAKTGEFWGKHKKFLKAALQKEVFVKTVIGKDTGEKDIIRAALTIKKINRNIPLILQPQHPFESELEKKLNYFRCLCEKEDIIVKIMAQAHKIAGIK